MLSTKITKSLILLSIAVLLVSSLASIDIGWAAGKYFSDITIESPINGVTLNRDNVMVNLNVTYNPWVYPSSIQVNCYLDGQFYTQAQLLETTEGYLGTTQKNYADMTQSIANGEFVLQNLSQGPHKLEINGTGKGDTKIINSVKVDENLSSVAATFYVNLTSTTTPTPNTSIISSPSDIAKILSGVIVIAVLASTVLVIVYRKSKARKEVTE